MSQNAQVKAKKSIYIVWVIPLVAMVLAGWMIFKHFDEKGSELVITFNNGNGMVVGKTALMYNGIKVGQVSDMRINKVDITKVDVTVTVDKLAASGALRKGNVFWKVEPKLSLTEVSGLSTILSGVYIGVLIGSESREALLSQPIQTHFIANDEIPVNLFDEGVLFTLHAKEYDIKVGAPVIYKKINIGKIVDATLKEGSIEYLVHVEKKYTYLVKDTSKLWKISGVEIRASLAGLRVQMDSLASVIAGGIALSSPSEGKVITSRKNEYKLYESIKELNLAKEVITLVSNDGYNIDTKAANIFFKGSRAGNIISMDYDPSKDQTTFKIRLKSEFSHLANKDAHFWIVEPRIGLDSIEGLGAISQGPYINFETSSASKEMKHDFILHTSAPQINGKHFRLIANESYSLKSGVNVIYKDIIIGTLRKFKLTKNSEKVVFDVLIASKYTYLVNDSSRFHIEGATELDASYEGIYLNIGSLSSMVNSGIVLKTSNLKAKKHKRNFTLFEDFRALEEDTYVNDGGKKFSLLAKTLGSIQKGSPLIYKGIKVGKVVSFTLNKDKGLVDINVYVKKEYADQVNISTSFFNRSGIEVKAGLDGVKIQTGSVEAIMRGGIAFKTPLMAKEVKKSHVFTLYEDEDAVDDKYVDISFLMKEESSLKEGSAIVYKSIPVGQVKDLKLVDDEIIIQALIKEEHTNLLAQDSIFWVEDIHIGIDEVKNPSAILSGAFIKVLKGSSEINASKFSLSNTAPVATKNKEGLRVLVTGTKLSSLDIGSPVFYRQVKIGSVESFGLSPDAKGVELKLFIDKCYRYLVKEDSIFYNATAIGVDVSLLGVKISTETISTMINGGISMVTPESKGEPAKQMQSFKLHLDPEEDWLEYAPELINNDSSCTSSRL